MTATAVMAEEQTISAQTKWTNATPEIRWGMLAVVEEPRMYANVSWKKLPYITRQNLDRKKWTA